jgi:uncharacterized protein (DUF2235 family)
MSVRRLVICLDGTWNTESSFTNVWRIFVALEPSATQILYYDQGVGTKATDFLTGGGFGRGLSNNVLKAYLWLTEHYRPSDEIFVFGFSRGAFTARSLVGFVSLCGLLRPDAPVNIDAAFELYRRPGLSRSSYAAELFREHNALERVYGTPCIKMLGVFDTVGALGAPVINLPLFEDYTWHKVHLSEIVENAYHALAIDEHRELFQATLWTNCYPRQKVEQRWFVGAHANVGGGYPHDALSIRPLEWMQAKAKHHGLDFHYDPCKVQDRREFLAAPITDSWAEFMGGSYAATRTVTHVGQSRRFYRAIGSPANWHPDRMPPEEGRWSRVKKKLSSVRQTLADRGILSERPAIPVGVNEVIDSSVDERVVNDPEYRPPNLCNFFDAKTWRT